ncbi:MAG: hypothetical protein ACRCUT_02510, partial [Spirochaetota bacterium]
LAGINREIASVLKVLGLYSELLISESAEEAREMMSRAGGGAFRKNPAENAEQPSAKSEPEKKKEVPPVIPGETEIQEGETLFPQPLIVECEECSAFVRVHSSGAFMCPSCHAEFSVERDGTVIF